MLVISRKESESIMIGEDIEVIISNIGSEKVKICISAPKHVRIVRKELLETQDMNKEANVQRASDSVNKLKQMLK